MRQKMVGPNNIRQKVGVCSEVVIRKGASFPPLLAHGDDGPSFFGTPPPVGSVFFVYLLAVRCLSLASPSSY